MAKKAPVARSPWENRWEEPSLEELIAPYQDNAKKVIDLLLEQLDSLEDVERSIRWHGVAWKWTIQYSLADEAVEDDRPLCYLVPKPEQLVVSIPMTQGVIATLPMRRLNRYVRDSIRSAKRAVELYWATWTPTAMTEVEHLVDLVKRKRKALRVAAGE